VPLAYFFAPLGSMKQTVAGYLFQHLFPVGFVQVRVAENPDSSSKGDQQKIHPTGLVRNRTCAWVCQKPNALNPIVLRL
jgi:hypothetical protein